MEYLSEETLKKNASSLGGKKLLKVLKQDVDLFIVK